MTNKNHGPKHDLTGQRFGFLEVLRMQYCPRDHRKEYKAVCKCHNCGCETIVFPYNLRTGQARSCGCDTSWYKHGKENHSFTGYEEITGSFWGRCRKGAERRNLEFSIDIKYAWDLFVEQNRRCAMTGIPIYMGNDKGHRATASIDRIDNSKGYVEGNIQWVHRNVNIIKHSTDFPYFINVCRRIALNPKFKDVPDMTDEECLKHKILAIGMARDS